MKEIYRLAGWLEGEGSFTWAKNKTLVISAVSTDRDVAAWAAVSLGVKLYGPYPGASSKRKKVWQVRATGPEAAGWMMTLYSLMGGRRKQQIESALACWKKYPTTLSSRRRLANRLDFRWVI